MKTRISLLLVLGFAIAMTSCMQGPQGEKVKTGDATEVQYPKDAIELNANLDASTIEWLGTKPTGTHFGTLSVQDGSVFIKDGKLLGGKFVMNMNSIVVLDIKDETMNANLVGHLKSADFFLVDSFPTATFEFSNVVPFESTGEIVEGVVPTHRLEGNLTMRGVTRKVNFPARIEVGDKWVKAETPQFVLNRTEWNVNYGSRSIFANLKDNFIHDEMGITIKLSTK